VTRQTAIAIAIIIAVPMIQLGITTSGRAASPPDEQVSFQEDVLPIFKRRCVPCHQQDGDGYKQSGLFLMTYQGVMAGTKFGPMVIPGNTQESNLMRIIDWPTSQKLCMPHERKQLSTCDRDTIRVWIRQGAKDN
jgi:hypothetical protein